MLKSFPQLIVFLMAIFVVSLFSSVNTAFAHDGKVQNVGEYIVSIAQYPLSPFVGEKEQITFDLEDKSGKPIEGVKGKLVIKETTVKQYVEKEAEVGNKIIYEEEESTDSGGSVGVTYTFQKEGVYDVEFIWGENEEDESAGLQVFAREPTSFFVEQELNKRIWLFVGIALAGFIAGALLTFILLTTTLHPKR
jgi:hypothetical protein